MKEVKMTPEELYEKEFGKADSIPKESVIRLLKHFAFALAIERNKVSHIHDVVDKGLKSIDTILK